jgi:hypothetical protein
MATNSYLAIKNENETYTYIYVHFDGAPKRMFPILSEYYNTCEKALELINLGDLSSVNEKINPKPDLPHYMENRQMDVCFAYHRDRKEDWQSVKPKTVANFESLPKDEYLYVFDSEWRSFGKQYK